MNILKSVVAAEFTLPHGAKQALQLQRMDVAAELALPKGDMTIQEVIARLFHGMHYVIRLCVDNRRVFLVFLQGFHYIYFS